MATPPDGWVPDRGNFAVQEAKALKAWEKFRQDIFLLIDEAKKLGGEVFSIHHDDITFEIPENRMEEFNDLVRRHIGSGSETP
jgi:hypothetical protein